MKPKNLILLTLAASVLSPYLQLTPASEPVSGAPDLHVDDTSVSNARRNLRPDFRMQPAVLGDERSVVPEVQREAPPACHVVGSSVC